MKNPKFSIITVCFNCKDDLEKTIKSVSSQKNQDYEYIVIDGASTDGSVDILKRYGRCIDYWVSEKDSGIYNAMNKGVRMAHGEYLFFLNAGDVFSNTDVLDEISKNISNEDLVYGNLRVVSKDGSVDKILKKILTKNNVKFGKKVSQQCVFVKREVFQEVGGLNEQYRIASDFDLLCKIFKKGKIIKYVDVLVCDYDNGGISSNLRKSYNDTANVIRDEYGVLYFVLYKIISILKLIIAKI